MDPIAHESSHFRVGGILLFCGELLIAIVVAAAVAFAMVGGFRLAGPSPALPARAPSADKSIPQLQVLPARDLDRYRQQQQDELNAYRWIDRDRGIAQIPVDSAMQIYAQQHPAASQARSGDGSP